MTTAKTIANIEVTGIRATTYGVRDGVDVSITVTVEGGVEIKGGATIAPDKVNGGWAVYGDSPDMWLSGKLLAALDRDGICAIRDVVESAA